jgi:hypothetical protein
MNTPPQADAGLTRTGLQMLEWTTAGGGARLGLLPHHDDAAREVAYDRIHRSASGARPDEAPAHGGSSLKDD